MSLSARAHELEFADGRLADAGDFAQEFVRSVHRLGKGAEAGDQRLGHGLGVAARRGAEQDQLEQLVLGEGVGAALAETAPEPLAMTVIMRLAGIFEAHSAFRPLSFRKEAGSTLAAIA